MVATSLCWWGVVVAFGEHVEVFSLFCGFGVDAMRFVEGLGAAALCFEVEFGGEVVHLVCSRGVRS